MVNTRSFSSRAGSAMPESSPPSSPPLPPTTPSTTTRRATASNKARLSSLAAASASLTPASKPITRSSSSSTTRPATTTTTWSHTPSALTLVWLAVSLPLVVWDTAYVLGRPHTMEHGRLHWPVWVPYGLYGSVDHVYGRRAYDARGGFTGAQAALNAVETVMYLVYAWACLVGAGGGGGGGGRKKGKGKGSGKNQSKRGAGVSGRGGARAVLVGFSAAVMTFSKTLLYWLHEYYSGFDNIGHNDLNSLIFLWIIPNGAWFVGSGWMIYSLGGDILDGLETASHLKTE